jgi:hypothetical protein
MCVTVFDAYNLFIKKRRRCEHGPRSGINFRTAAIAAPNSDGKLAQGRRPGFRLASF